MSTKVHSVVRRVFRLNIFPNNSLWLCRDSNPGGRWLRGERSCRQEMLPAPDCDVTICTSTCFSQRKRNHGSNPSTYLYNHIPVGGGHNERGKIDKGKVRDWRKTGFLGDMIEARGRAEVECEGPKWKGGNANSRVEVRVRSRGRGRRTREA